MGCECIPPPPVFDLPVPPDPSLIWHLISDEPEDYLRKVRLQSCEFSPLFEFVGLDGTFQTFLLFAIGCCLIVLCTVCTITLIWKKLCSRNHNKRSPSTSSSKLNSSSDTIITGPSTSHWSVRSPKMVSVGMPMYGSASTSNIVGINSIIRTQPKMGVAMPGNAATLRGPRCQQYYPRNMAVRVPTDPHHQGSAYCTLDRHYEEIPVNYALPPASASMTTSISHNPILVRGPSVQFEQPTNAMMYLDMLAKNAERRPAPLMKPPPPPMSTASTEEDNSSVDAELEKINQNHHCSSPPNSRQSEGRESGYGTGPSRLWNIQSPKAPPRSSSKDPNHSKSPQITGSTNSSPQGLSVYEKDNPMTYV